MADYIKFHSVYPTARHTQTEDGELPILNVEVTTNLDRTGYFKPSVTLDISKGSYMSQKAYFNIDALDVLIGLLQAAKADCVDYKEKRMEALLLEKEELEGEIDKQAEALDDE